MAGPGSRPGDEVGGAGGGRVRVRGRKGIKQAVLCNALLLWSQRTLVSYDFEHSSLCHLLLKESNCCKVLCFLPVSANHFESSSSRPSFRDISCVLQRYFDIMTKGHQCRKDMLTSRHVWQCVAPSNQQLMLFVRGLGLSDTYSISPFSLTYFRYNFTHCYAQFHSTNFRWLTRNQMVVNKEQIILASISIYLFLFVLFSH